MTAAANITRPRRASLAAAAVLASLAAVAPARADIFATWDHRSPIGGKETSLLSRNLTAGAGASLPAGVNDPAASEFHPALSPNGRYLVFQRVAAGAVRILMFDRATGQSADLFHAFEAAADPPNTPTFSLDGTKVITGRRLERRDPASPPGALQSSFTETDVTNFPSGPFPHRIVLAGGTDSTSAGRTLQAMPFGSNLLAFGVEYASGGAPGRITVRQATGATTLSDPTRRFADPAISESAGVVVFESAPAATPSTTRLVFRPLDGFATAPTTELPALVNAPGTIVSDPAFTPDGRYLAFRRGDALYVWDTQTQLLLVNGISFVTPDPTDGAIALEVRRVLTSTTLASGLATFTLSQNSPTGLLVQRIVGRQKLLGRTAPRLSKVGRVPLGTFAKGRHSKRWGFTVNGHTLRRGCYLVTFRALTSKRQVRDLSTPYTVSIRERTRPLVSKGIRLHTCRGGKH
jgi:WD40-like Beta Propeller Repeat